MYYTYIQNGMSYRNGTDGIDISTLLPLRRRIGCAIARIIRTGSQNLLNAFQYVKFIFLCYKSNISSRRLSMRQRKYALVYNF